MVDVKKTTPKIVTPVYGEQGRTGTNIFGGVIYEEYLTDLQGWAGLTIYDKMRRSDSTVAGALSLLKLPIVQADWTIIASPHDEEMGEDIANFVEHVLFGGMDYTWEYVLQQALLMLEFGFCPLEKVWELRTPPEDLELPGLSGDVVWLKKISPRMPNTIDEWVFNDTTRDLEKIHQTTPTGDKCYIDRDKLAIFVHHKEGDNWEGRSVLRSAYKHWYIKDALEKIDAIGHERTSLGIPYFQIMEGYAYDPDSEEGKNLIARLVDIARHLRANEESFVIMTPGVEFDLKSLGQDNKSLLASIQHHDLHLMVNILAQFMTLGQTTSGSRAVAETQRGPFNLELLAIADNLATTFEREVIRDLVIFNFGERPGYPQLTAKGVVETNQQPLALMVSQLCQYGVIVPDENLENWLRELLGLPAKTLVSLAPTTEEPVEDAEIEPDEGLGDDDMIPEEPSEGPSVPTAAIQKPKPNSSTYTEDPLNGPLFWREPTEEERYVAFQEIHFELEASKQRFMTIVGSLAHNAVNRMVDGAVEYVRSGNPKALSEMSVPEDDIQTLSEIIQGDVYVPLANYGAQSVREEKSRAQEDLPVRPTQVTVSRLDEDPNFFVASDMLSDYQESRARAVAESILGNSLSTVKAQSFKYVRAPVLGIDPETQIVSAVSNSVDIQVRAAANDTVSEAFSMGRGVEIQTQVSRGDVRYAIYSALLDRNLCEACRARDGEVYTPDQEEFYRFMDGNAEECFGGSRCRCLLLLAY